VTQQVVLMTRETSLAEARPHKPIEVILRELQVEQGLIVDQVGAVLVSDREGMHLEQIVACKEWVAYPTQIRQTNHTIQRLIAAGDHGLSATWSGQCK